MNDPEPESKPATSDNQKASAELRCMALLAAVVRKHYNPIEDPKGCDGAQMWNGQWWMPLWGCDTLDNMLDDMAYAIECQQAANAGAEAQPPERPNILERE